MNEEYTLDKLTDIVKYFYKDKVLLDGMPIKLKNNIELIPIEPDYSKGILQWIRFLCRTDQLEQDDIRKIEKGETGFIVKRPRSNSPIKELFNYQLYLLCG